MLFMSNFSGVDLQPNVLHLSVNSIHCMQEIFMRALLNIFRRYLSL